MTWDARDGLHSALPGLLSGGLYHHQQPAEGFPPQQGVAATLGDQLLVAPVLEAGVERLQVALPAGTWGHLWSQARYRASPGTRVEVAATIGQPAVFYPEGSAVGEVLHQALRGRGITGS